MQLMNSRQQNNIAQQFAQFQQQLAATGKNPEQILYELKASGKVTQDQINKATQLAKLAQGFIR